MDKYRDVLIICPFTSPNQGGVESHIQKLLEYIHKRKKTTTVLSYQPLTSKTKAPFHEKKTSYQIYRLPWFANGIFPKIEHNPVLTFLYLVPGLLFLSFFWTLKHKKNFKVVHAHGFAAGFIGMLIKPFLPQKGFVLSTHAIYDLQSRPILGFLLKIIMSSYDFILAVGEPSLEEIVKLGISRDRVAVHPNWVDTKFFSPKKSNKRKRLTVIFVGRGLRKKGIFEYGELAKQNKDMDFIIRVADGPDLDEYLKKYGKQDNLDIRTELPKNFEAKMRVIRDEYRQADVFVMPSQYPEGFAAVVTEACSAGLAILSSNLGCLPDILSESGAVLVKPTVNNLNRGLKLLTKNRVYLNRAKRMSRAHALRKFSDKNARIIFDSYRIN